VRLVRACDSGARPRPPGATRPARSAARALRPDAADRRGRVRGGVAASGAGAAVAAPRGRGAGRGRRGPPPPPPARPRPPLAPARARGERGRAVRTRCGDGGDAGRRTDRPPLSGAGARRGPCPRTARRARRSGSPSPARRAVGPRAPRGARGGRATALDPPPARGDRRAGARRRPPRTRAVEPSPVRALRSRPAVPSPRRDRARAPAHAPPAPDRIPARARPRARGRAPRRRSENAGRGDGMTLIALWKPYAYVSRFTPDGGHPGLAELVRARGVYPIGRLDHDSEGLLLLGDDGALAHRLSRPGRGHPRVYWVQVEGAPDAAALRALERGVTVQGR